MSPHRKVVKTIYFVRHAEAVHNAQEQVIQQVMSPRSATTARENLLLDPQFVDAALTVRGEQQVEESRRSFDTAGCVQPTLVLVSPLQRTVQTALKLFPRRPIRASELVRERRTGRPCDERRPAAELAGTFRTVDFGEILQKDSNSSDGYEVCTPFSSLPHNSDLPYGCLRG